MKTFNISAHPTNLKNVLYSLLFDMIAMTTIALNIAAIIIACSNQSMPVSGISTVLFFTN